jgi:transketolase
MNLHDLPKRATRDGFAEGLLEAARQDRRVVALSADLGDSTKAIVLKEVDPSRYLEVGIAEQNMVGMAAGLALTGMVPFATSFGTFLQRGWEQIRVSVAYNQTNVKLVGTHCGVQTGPDGATAQMLEDLALMRVLPNMTVIVPADAHQAKLATLAAAEFDGPVYLRFGRESLPVWSEEMSDFTIGRAQVLCDGTDAAIIACGAMVYEALLAAGQLRSEQINVRVINMPTIKPLDIPVVLDAAKHTGAVVTAEEHQIMGGLGSAIAEVLGQQYPVPLEMIGIRDQFGQSGTATQLFEHYGLTSENIVKAVRRAMSRKEKP